ncbi:MAG: helix-turn-helix domain-containing protein [Spirochaetaceae bacterium]|jgi:two-component system response regulator YesN|nr:helix-turn-helix domain-containing protein [Spirochaetaceae bacterium]
MNRIFLVDEEFPVLESLSAAIKKAFPGLEICGAAGDLGSAVEGVCGTRPDIIIMDPRLGGLSGLEALRELRPLVPDSVFILFTACERFDLAREAFSLGVYRYLLKPVNQDLLADALRGALSRLNAVKDNAIRSASALEKLKLAKPLIEAGFVYSLLSGSPASPLTDACAEWLSLKTGVQLIGHFAALYRQNDPKTPYHPLFPDEETLVKREITNRLDCVAGSDTGGLLPLFIKNGNTSRSKEAIEEALKSTGNPQIRYALGRVSQGASLKDTWRELVADIAGGVGRNRGDELQAIIDAANCSSFQAVQAAFARWSSGLGQHGDGDRAILAGALAALAGGSGGEIVSAGKTQMRLAVQDSKDAEQAAYLISLTLESLSCSGPALREADTDRRVSAALRFIAEHYGEPISLDDAAQRAGISAAHLSRIVCSETGESFSSHLAGQRIRRACRELSAGVRSIKELAVLCGFSNANYFSRAFKKTMGITPSEYARKRGP